MSSPDDFRQRFESMKREHRAEALVTLPRESLIALAGAPFWTQPALAAAGLDLEDITEAARPLVQRDGFDADATVSLSREAVADVVQFIQKNEIPAAPFLATLGERVGSVERKPPVLERWVEIAKWLKEGPDSAAEHLLSQIRTRCDRNELGPATELLEAAGAVARAVGGQVEVAERVARHRLEREFRLARDRRHLSFFVGRDDALAAFKNLLAEQGPWALHYIGVGGAGKTTFIQHLAVAQADKLGLAVARIDFDYLSAAYPGRDPGQLVEAIVHELTIHIERAEQDRFHRSIHEALDRVRHVAREVSDTDAIGPIEWPEFQELLSYFSSFLASFTASNKRPLIILDTCEELMKLSPVQGKIPSVEATFRLVEELHSRVPALRVIFAGRRLLARGGAGWNAIPELVTHGLSEARPYLAIHELRGMTRKEALLVLEQLVPARREGDANLRETVLAKCPEDSRVNGIAFADVDKEPRYSPFRIVRFARWLEAEPELDIAKLEQGGDPYIEQRIVERMGRLEPLLPTIVLLRRFDASTLAAVLGQPLNAAEKLVTELAGHEWLYAYSFADRGTVVEAKTSIREQLEAYLRTKRAAAYEKAREQIACALTDQFASDTALSLAPERIDAALRTMPELAAVRAWYLLEGGIGHNWDTALTLTRFLLGDGAAGADETSLLGCAIRATHASALIHQQPDVDVTDIWEQILETLQTREPIGPVRVLGARARLGRVAAAGWKASMSGDLLAGEFEAALKDLGSRPPSVAATWIVAAFEGLIERLERDYKECRQLSEWEYDAITEADAAEDADRQPFRQWWQKLGLSFAPPLEAFMTMLSARAAILLVNVESMSDGLRKALACTSWELPATLLDWLPPSSVEARIRLEIARLEFFTNEASPQVLGDQTKLVAALAPKDWLGELVGKDEDTQRLRAAHALRTYVGEGELNAPVTPPRELGLREPAVYRRFGRMQLVAAELKWDSMETPGGLSRSETVRLNVLRSRRCRNPAILPSEQTYGSAAAALFVEIARASAIVLDRVEKLPAKVDPPINIVEHWSYQRALTSAETDATIDAVRAYVAPLRTLMTDADASVAQRAYTTLEEIVTLSRYTKDPLPAGLRRTALRLTHPDQMELVIRLDLRVAAAAPAFVVPKSVEMLLDLAPGVVARCALDEGELLSLRFPDRAARLLEFAAERFVRVGDRANAQAATLAREICLRMLGESTFKPCKPDVPALQPLADWLADPKTTVPKVVRVRPRKPRLQARAKALATRLKDWGLILLALVAAAIVIVLLLKVSADYFVPWLQHISPTFFKTGWRSTLIAFSAFIGLLSFISNKFGIQWFKDVFSIIGDMLWPFRASISIEPEGTCMRVTLQHRERRHSWTVARPHAGQIPTIASSPDDRRNLKEATDEIAEMSGATITVRADISRSAIGAAWEAALVEKLPNLVVWRAVSRQLESTLTHNISRGLDLSEPRSAFAPTDIESDLIDGWLKAARASKVDSLRGVAHLLGRPRRRVGSIELERSSPRGIRQLTNLDVVLQLALQERDQASAASRTEMSLMRELAWSMIERGARSVLVIPAISRDGLARLVKALGEAYGSEPERRLARLANAVRAARAAVASVKHTDHAVVALEVTLFMATTDSPRS